MAKVAENVAASLQCGLRQIVITTFFRSERTYGKRSG